MWFKIQDEWVIDLADDVPVPGESGREGMNLTQYMKTSWYGHTFRNASLSRGNPTMNSWLPSQRTDGA